MHGFWSCTVYGPSTLVEANEVDIYFLSNNVIRHMGLMFLELTSWEVVDCGDGCSHSLLMMGTILPVDSFLMHSAHPIPLVQDNRS